ncbi:hypothetical protein WJF53_23330, partial [Salmonella enterica subsp. enterica serovar Corvallis]
SESCDLKAPISDLNILLEGMFYIISLILETRFRAEEAFWMRDETSLKNKHESTPMMNNYIQNSFSKAI